MLLHFVPDVAIVATPWTDAADTSAEAYSNIFSFSQVTVVKNVTEL